MSQTKPGTAPTGATVPAGKADDAAAGKGDSPSRTGAPPLPTSETELTYAEAGLEVETGGAVVITVPDAGFDVPLRFRDHPDVEEEEAVVKGAGGAYRQARKFTEGYRDGGDTVLIFSGIELGQKYDLEVTAKGEKEPCFVARAVEAAEDRIRAAWKAELDPQAATPETIDMAAGEAGAEGGAAKEQ